jgi:hypothetical protein
MTLHVPRLPLSLDPLIAEARQRMRRRRAALAVLVLAIAVSLTFALWPSGGHPGVRSGQSVNAQHELARLTVPIDKYERQWRRWVLLSSARTGPGGYLRHSSLIHIRRTIRAAVTGSGAMVIRLAIWDLHSPRVELVMATATPPAAYLKHDLGRLLGRIPGEYRYVKVVDRQGASIFENFYRVVGVHLEGMVGVPPALGGCSPVKNWGRTPPPCPVK